MAKVVSPTTAKRASTTKASTAPLKPRSRSTKEATELPLSPTPEPNLDGLQLLTEPHNILEEKITASVSSRTVERKNLESPPPPISPGGSPEGETSLPLGGDLI